MRIVSLKRVDQTKFSGVIVDKKLSFKGHVDTLSKKSSSVIGAIKRVKFFLPDSVVFFLFFSCLTKFTIWDLCLGVFRSWNFQ